MVSRKHFLAACITILLFIVLYSSLHDHPKEVHFKLLLPEEDDDEAKKTNRRTIFQLNLHYHLLPERCGDFPILWLITSYFGNVEVRSSIRRAFPREKLVELGVRRVFLLGEAPDDKYISDKEIFNEFQRFGDLLQGNFLEAYRNLTYKHLMGYKFAVEFCKHVDYVFKMDDDIVIDLPSLVQLIESKTLPKKKLLAGYILRGLPVKRQAQNKWFVSVSEFPEDVYPTFLSGWFYVTNIATIKLLLGSLKGKRYFWVDDVFITGVLARDLGIKHLDLGRYFTVHSEFIECCIRDALEKNISCKGILIGPNGGENNLFYSFKNALQACKKNHCTERTKSLNATCVGEKRLHFSRGDAFVAPYKLS